MEKIEWFDYAFSAYPTAKLRASGPTSGVSIHASLPVLLFTSPKQSYHRIQKYSLGNVIKWKQSYVSGRYGTNPTAFQDQMVICYSGSNYSNSNGYVLRFNTPGSAGNGTSVTLSRLHNGAFTVLTTQSIPIVPSEEYLVQMEVTPSVDEIRIDVNIENITTPNSISFFVVDTNVNRKYPTPEIAYGAGVSSGSYSISPQWKDGELETDIPTGNVTRLDLNPLTSSAYPSAHFTNSDSSTTNRVVAGSSPNKTFNLSSALTPSADCTNSFLSPIRGVKMLRNQGGVTSGNLSSGLTLCHNGLPHSTRTCYEAITYHDSTSSNTINRIVFRKVVAGSVVYTDEMMFSATSYFISLRIYGNNVITRCYNSSNVFVDDIVYNDPSPLPVTDKAGIIWVGTGNAFGTHSYRYIDFEEQIAGPQSYYYGFEDDDLNQYPTDVFTKEVNSNANDSVVVARENEQVFLHVHVGTSSVIGNTFNSSLANEDAKVYRVRLKCNFDPSVVTSCLRIEGRRVNTNANSNCIRSELFLSSSGTYQVKLGKVISSVFRGPGYTIPTQLRQTQYILEAWAIPDDTDTEIGFIVSDINGNILWSKTLIESDVNFDASRLSLVLRGGKEIYIHWIDVMYGQDAIDANYPEHPEPEYEPITVDVLQAFETAQALSVNFPEVVLAEIASETTQALSIIPVSSQVKIVRDVIVAREGLEPQVSLSGLNVKWYDNPNDPTPRYINNNGTTDDQGEIVINLDGITSLQIGQKGYLTIFEPSTGRAFGGLVTVRGEEVE